MLIQKNLSKSSPRDGNTTQLFDIIILTNRNYWRVFESEAAPTHICTWTHTLTIHACMHAHTQSVPCTLHT